MVRMGVLDLGSNSFHLLVADVDPARGEVVRVASDKRMVRLAAGTSSSGILDAAAWSRGLTAVDELVAPHAGAMPIVAVATSALREAANGVAFVQAIRRRWSVDARIVGELEEARLAFAGATAGTTEDPVCVVDLGGGSAQLAAGAPGPAPRHRFSFPLGVLRLRQRYLGREAFMSDETAAEIAAEVAQRATAAAEVIRGIAPRAVYVASGTARQLVQIATLLGLASSARLSLEVLEHLASRLRSAPDAELEALEVEPGRRDTIATGALVLATLTRLLGVPAVTMVPRGVREGAALEALRQPARPPTVEPLAAPAP